MLKATIHGSRGVLHTTLLCRLTLKHQVMTGVDHDKHHNNHPPHHPATPETNATRQNIFYPHGAPKCWTAPAISRAFPRVSRNYGAWTVEQSQIAGVTHAEAGTVVSPAHDALAANPATWLRVVTHRRS